MSYTQNNPLSRKSSPLNKDDQWIQKATADIKKRGTEGVCTCLLYTSDAADE